MKRSIELISQGRKGEEEVMHCMLKKIWIGLEEVEILAIGLLVKGK